MAIKQSEIIILPAITPGSALHPTLERQHYTDLCLTQLQRSELVDRVSDFRFAPFLQHISSELLSQFSCQFSFRRSLIPGTDAKNEICGRLVEAPGRGFGDPSEQPGGSERGKEHLLRVLPRRRDSKMSMWLPNGKISG